MRMDDGRTIYAVDALHARTGARLHTTYVNARSEQGAARTGRYWLSIFCRGEGAFRTRVRIATPQELGCGRPST